MRLDIELVSRNLYPTRAKAVTAIESGRVSVNGVIVKKSSKNITKNDIVKAKSLPFVSGRGTMKLSHALMQFNIDPTDFVCLDIGSSTGGFTEILLKHGAKKIIAVDVGHDQMIDQIKNDPRVVLMEGTDIRKLAPIEPVDLIVIDVSFISLSDIAAAVAAWNSLIVIALIKPQFEVSSSVARRADGVIKSPADRAAAIDRAELAFAKHGYKMADVTESPIRGGSGNVEYLALFRRI